MTGSPLSGVRVPVPFDSVRAEDIEPAVDALLRESSRRIDAIATAERTYAGTLEALDLATTELDYATNVVSHLESVVGSPALRDAWSAVLPKVSAFFTGVVLSAPLYRALRELEGTPEARALTGARR